jgi:hypothetical protein
MKLVELIPHALEPLTESGTYQFNASAIAFQNSGNADVKINSFYTIKAGGSLQFSVSDETNVIITGNWSLKFGSGNNPMLEVMLLIPRDSQFTNYVQQ